MKKYSTVILLMVLNFLTINCKGQDKEISSQDNDSIKTKMLHELDLRNIALKENNVTKIYFYSHPSELRGKSFEEFKNDSQKYLDATERDKLSVQNFEVLKVGQINFCNSQYQSIINLKTNMIMDKNEFSYNRKIVAISKDGKEWKFINGGENNLKTIKKLYPVVCINQE